MLSGAAHAQGERYQVRNWGVEDGLPQGSVTGIVESSDGYLWLTTFGGIARFDGVRFVVYDQTSNPELPTSRFVAVLEDGAGDLWFETEGQALVRYRDGRFSVVAPSAGGWTGPPAGLALDDQGHVWAVVSGILVRVEGDRVVPVPEARTAAGGPFRLQGDAAGGIWLVRDAGLLCWAGACTHGKTLLPATVADHFAPLLGADGGGVWLSDWPTAPACAGVGPQPGDHRWLRVIAWNGETWCAASNGVLHGGDHRIDLLQGTRLGAAATRGIRATVVSSDGSLWIGAIGGGLFRVRPTGVERWGPEQGLETSTRSIGEDRLGRVWVAGEHHLALFSGSTLVPRPPPLQGLTDIRALTTGPDGDLWVAADLGVSRYTGEALIPVGVPEIAHGSINALLVEPDGSLWAGGDGLVRVKDGVALERYGPERLGASVLTLERDGDALWIGMGEGLARLRAGALTLFSTAQGLPRGQVRDVQQTADGSVWAAIYGGGLARIRADHVTTVGVAQGLCEGVASRIIEDDDGVFWINGNRGVSRIRRSELEAVADGRARSVRCDLVDTGEGNGNAGLRADDGSLWFPTVNGVARVSPDQLPIRTPPVSKIESIRLDDRLLDDGDVAGPGRGDLLVQYTGLGLGDGPGVLFQTRLVGLEEDWRPTTADRRAHYANLKPGAYRFEVRARSPGSAWGEPAVASFSFPTVWYQRPALAVAAAIAAVLLGVGATRLRVRDLEQHTRALEAEIADRRRAEAELGERERHYRTLFQRTTDGLFVYTEDGHLVEMNPAAMAMVGSEALTIPEPTFLGEPYRETLRALIRTASTGDTMGSVEATLHGPKGTLEVVMEAAQLERNGAPGALVSVRDVTGVRQAERERQRLEAELQQVQKLEALGQLAGGIAHDFNNLLTVIRIHANLLGDGLEGDALSDVSAITAAVDRAQGMTTKLLVFAGRRASSARLVDLRTQVDATLAVLKSAVPADIRFEVHHHDLPLQVDMDPIRLDQIVMNLVFNARDALPRGGTIRVTTDLLLVRPGEAHRNDVSEGFFASLSVADDGDGIDPALLGRIFDPFFTTKPPGKGTGLGLSTVHGAVREALGWISVTSAAGVGTTFVIRIPLSTEQAVAPAVHRPPPPAVRPGALVLVCDDEPGVLAVVARTLRNAGYRVITAGSAREAVAAAEGVDLLVTDVVMPDMNGPELATAVKLAAGPIPVLFLSGHTRDLVEERGIETNADLLWKPFRREDLLARVAALLG